MPAAVKDMETRTAEAQQKQLERQAMLREERRRSAELAMESYATITYAGGMYGELRSCLDPTPLTRERPKSAGAVVSGGFRSKRFMEAPPLKRAAAVGEAQAPAGAGAGAAGARSSAAHIASTIDLIYPSTSPMLRPPSQAITSLDHNASSTPARRSRDHAARQQRRHSTAAGVHACAPDVGAGTRPARLGRSALAACSWQALLRAGFVWFLHRRQRPAAPSQLRRGPCHSRQAADDTNLANHPKEASSLSMLSNAPVASTSLPARARPEEGI